MKQWVRMPAFWVRNEDELPLAKMKWVGPKKSDQIAALLIYPVLVHHANEEVTSHLPERGLCKLTYSTIGNLSGLSRAKIAGGLKILESMGLISLFGTGRDNVYQISNFENVRGWGKLPASGLYSDDRKSIPVFHRFQLRSKNELSALKIYYLLVAMRDNASGYARVGYEKIQNYTGVPRNEIKSALSLLINLGLIHVDSGKSAVVDFGTVNLYRLRYLEPYKHRGTTLRDEEFSLE